MILYMYVARDRGWQPLRDEILMSTGTFCHFGGHLLQVSKTSLWSLILYNFSMILYMYVAPWQGQTAPRGQILMSIETYRHFIHFFTSLKKCLWSHHLKVYSRMSGTVNPRGQNFDVNRNPLSLWSFVTSFNKISLKSDFIEFCLWFYTCI